MSTDALVFEFLIIDAPSRTGIGASLSTAISALTSANGLSIALLSPTAPRGLIINCLVSL